MKALLIGPVELALIIEVERYPSEDHGAFFVSKSYSMTWDTPIVAQTLCELYTELEVIIAGPIQSCAQRYLLNSNNESRIEYIDISSTPVSLDSDFRQDSIVIISRTYSTRTWLADASTERSVDLSKLNSTFSKLQPSAIYLDAPLANIDVLTTVFRYQHNHNCIVLLNFGDTTELTIPNFPDADPAKTILQFSAKGQLLDKARDTLRHLIVSEHLTLPTVITRGKVSSVVFDGDDLCDISVEVIERARTVGAGSILSAHLLRELTERLDIRPYLEGAMKRSVAEVSKAIFLRGSDSDPGPNGKKAT